MSWRIFKKAKEDFLRTKCLLCRTSFVNGDIVLETKSSGWNSSETDRFHIKCINSKIKDL